MGIMLAYYSDVIMSTMTSQITVVSIVYSTVYSGAYQIKHQSSTSLTSVRGIHRDGGFPSQRASNAESVSIWWCHHDDFADWSKHNGKHYYKLLYYSRSFYLIPRVYKSLTPQSCRIMKMPSLDCKNNNGCLTFHVPQNSARSDILDNLTFY